MFSVDNMDPHKAAALKAFGVFINAPTAEPGSTTNGDLLARLGVDKHCIVGTRDGIDVLNTRSFAVNEMGTGARAEIAGITIVNEDGTTVGGSNLLGVAHLADNSALPNITYYLVTNLNSSDADVRLKISLRSSNARKNVRATNLTYPDQLSNQVFPKTGVVPVTLPAHAALILKFENTN